MRDRSRLRRLVLQGPRLDPRSLLRGLPRGLTMLEILVALGILVIALVAIYGLVGNAVRSFGVGEDFLDVQQNARVALEKFSEEARWTARLIDDATFFGRTPAAAPPPPCTGNLCPESANLEIPRSNPVIGDCTYYVRFARDGANNTFTRHVKPDPAQGAPFGTGGCVATGPQPLATLVSAIAGCCPVTTTSVG